MILSRQSLVSRVEVKNLKKLKRYLKIYDSERTLFRRPAESLFFVAKNFVIRLLHNQLTYRFLHMGVKTKQTHQAFRPMLAGFYSGMSVINVDLQLYHFRRMIKFVMTFLLKNYRLCLISHQLHLYFEKARFAFGYHMVFDYWIPGTVSNFITLSKQKVRKQNRFIKRYPQFLIAMKLDPIKFYSIAQEARRAGLPMISFLDVDLDLTYFNYFFPVNMRYLTSFKYNLFLLTTLFRRAMLLKKYKFYRKTNVFKAEKI